VVVRSTGGDEPQRERVFQAYLEGVEAFRRRDWIAAETQFSIILGLDQDNERAHRYLEEIGRERRFEVQLSAARASRGQNDLAQAYAQASSIVESTYTPEAEVILRGIEVELDARVARARTTLEVGRPKEALNLLHSVDEIREGRADVVALRNRAVQALTTAGEPAPESSVAPSSPRVPSKPSAARGRTLAERATDLFADGRTWEALRTLEAAGNGREVKNLRRRIDRFDKTYNVALEAHRKKRTQNAITQLNQAKSLAAKLVRSDSHIVAEVNRKIADMYYVQGVEPMLARRYAEAYRHFRTAISLAPGHAPSAHQLDLLASKARRLFEEGNRVWDTQPEVARERWILVMQIVPPDNEHYRKAQQRLDTLP
jgi:tetratricopeptide (TPR) repeat protein